MKKITEVDERSKKNRNWLWGLSGALLFILLIATGIIPLAITPSTPDDSITADPLSVGGFYGMPSAGSGYIDDNVTIVTDEVAGNNTITLSCSTDQNLSYFMLMNYTYGSQSVTESDLLNSSNYDVLYELNETELGYPVNLSAYSFEFAENTSYFGYFMKTGYNPIWLQLTQPNQSVCLLRYPNFAGYQYTVVEPDEDPYAYVDFQLSAIDELNISYNHGGNIKECDLTFDSIGGYYGTVTDFTAGTQKTLSLYFNSTLTHAFASDDFILNQSYRYEFHIVESETQDYTIFVVELNETFVQNLVLEYTLLNWDVDFELSLGYYDYGLDLSEFEFTNQNLIEILRCFE